MLGGISADRLVQIYGTPLLAIDLAVVDAAIEQLLRCATGLKLEIAYAAKAFATVEFVRHLAARSIGLDVCSLGELVTAERAGFPAQRLTLHGAGKTEQELRAACGGRVGYIVVDGIEELEALARLSRDASCAQVILRLNVGIEAQTHAFVRTGGDDTKFGIPGARRTRRDRDLARQPTVAFCGSARAPRVADPPAGGVCGERGGASRRPPNGSSARGFASNGS